MTTPLIEAIARAICANTGGFAWECAPDDTKDGCLGDAQAALTAITEAGYRITRDDGGDYFLIGDEGLLRGDGA